MKYTFATRPYPHQREALKKLLEQEWGGALLMSPRTGKTKTIIDFAAIKHLEGKIKKVLVLAPLSVLDVWVDQFEQHCSVDYEILVWDRKARKKGKSLHSGWNGGLQVVVVNYDALSMPARKKDPATGRMVRARTTKKTKTGRIAVRNKLRAWKPDLIVLDESHLIGRLGRHRTRMVHSLAPGVKYRIIATGTVLTGKKRMLDVYSQWKFLNPERFADFDHAEDFREHFGVWTSRNGFPQLLKTRNVRELQERIHMDSFAVTRQECFPHLKRLPDEVIHVELEESRRYYDQMAADMVAKIEELGEQAYATIKLVQILRLHQITSGLLKVQDPEERLRRVGSEKLKYVKDWLSNLFEAEEKVVVAARFRPDIEALVQTVKKMRVPVHELHGGVPRADRKRAIAAFQRGKGPRLFVMQPRAGALGIDLSSANVMAWFSLTNSMVDFMQAEDRIALAQNVAYTYFLAKNTVDEVLRQSLREDGDVLKMVCERPKLLLQGTG